MIPQWIIEKKRDGKELTQAEITGFINGYTQGTIPDYQMAALAMAIFFQGMNPAETARLTDAMMKTGDLITFDAWERPIADKHSTGGIGDKLSLMIAPLAAAAGVDAPMIAGRGLGITGGTLDKLESIPGYNTKLSTGEYKQVTAQAGCAIAGQTANLVPADRLLYSLRDVTGTVPSIPLITASIMSKKLAGGSPVLVFDVKCGKAAFMQSIEAAQELATNLIRTGTALNRKCLALITAMDQPLGRSIGNSVEVIEAVETLKGGGPTDTRLLTIELVAMMTQAAGVDPDRVSARHRVTEILDSGAALTRFKTMVALQGGTTEFIDNPRVLPQAAASLTIRSPVSGYITNVDAEKLGRIALQLGAGRRSVKDSIDYGAGIDHLVQHGEKVETGDSLMQLHSKDISTINSLQAEALKAITIAAEKPESRPLILEEV